MFSPRFPDKSRLDFHARCRPYLIAIGSSVYWHWSFFKSPIKRLQIVIISVRLRCPFQGVVKDRIWRSSIPLLSDNISSIEWMSTKAPSCPLFDRKDRTGHCPCPLLECSVLSWSHDLKTNVLKVPVSGLRNTLGTSKSFLTEETLKIIEENRRATLEERTGTGTRDGLHDVLNKRPHCALSAM